MKKILIASFDMEIGGVERSLISMLDNFDYHNYRVDLMLYRQQGELMSLVNKQVNLLPEVSEYSTFRKSIRQCIKDQQYLLSLSRIFAKLAAQVIGKVNKMTDPGYLQMQLMWRYAQAFLPKIKQEYDVAISYLWPHYFVGEKVKAQTKIAWIHTDYSSVETDIKLDIQMWNKFDYLIAVSEECKTAFLQKYNQLAKKVIVIENLTAPERIKEMAEEKTEHRMHQDPRFKIVTVARLSHAKGIDQAVKALKLLKDKGYQEIAWYVVGYGGDEPLIRQLIDQYNLKDSFILLGKRDNPYPFIKRADLYVQPSRYEGKAITVTEAQILGKPTVITNYTTAGSQVSNGLDGYITELSVAGIAAGVEKLYNEPELRTKLAAYCSNKDYGNNNELTKLYQLIEK